MKHTFLSLFLSLYAHTNTHTHLLFPSLPPSLSLTPATSEHICQTFNRQQLSGMANEDDLRRTLVGLCRDIRGIALAFHSRNTYILLFDWMYPPPTLFSLVAENTILCLSLSLSLSFPPSLPPSLSFCTGIWLKLLSIHIFGYLVRFNETCHYLGREIMGRTLQLVSKWVVWQWAPFRSPWYYIHTCTCRCSSNCVYVHVHACNSKPCAGRP